jgi:hypothetical protein
VVAGYVLLTCLFYWQGVRHMASHYISDGADGANFLWSYWHIPHALGQGHNPFGTNLLFWPVGVRLGFHTTTPLEALIAWPLTQVFGSVLGINLLQLAAVPLTGVGAYLLAKHECEDDRVAFFAGAAFMLIHQHTGRMVGHWNLNHLWVLPFGLWFLLRLYDRPTWGRAVALGAMGAVVFLTDLTFFVFWLGAGLVIAAWRWRETLTRALATRLAAGGVVTAIGSLPLLLSMARDLRGGELDHLRGWGGAHEHSADLLGFFTPSIEHPLWGGLFHGVKGSVFGLEEYAYAGLAVLGLAIAAVVMRRRAGTRVGVWVLLAVGSAVLALGPFLHVNGWTGGRFTKFGESFSVPLPYALFHSIPVLSGLRIPGRFSMVTALALDVLAAVALARLIRGRAPRVQWAVVAVVLAVTLVEFLPPPHLRLQSPRVPAAYQAIEASPDRGAVLEIPLFWRDGFGQIGAPDNHDIFLYYATKHGRPLVGGMVARLPEARRAALYGVDEYRQLLTLQHQVGFKDPANFTAADLRGRGIGFVVYHRSRPMPDVLAYVSGLGMEQLADDGDTVVWHVPV